jgi:hypothetical protein
MNNTHIAHSQVVVALEVVLSPSSIPPAPQSGVVVRGKATKSASPARSVAAVPCAAFWPGAAEAATLHTSQVLAAAVDEIDWLYENTDDETDPTCIQARATIEGWLSELTTDHQLAIAAHHDPLPWPEDLPGHEEDSYALVLHLLLPSEDRDLVCYTPGQLETRARRRLVLLVEHKGVRALTPLIRRARWLFEEAVREYAKVRGRAPSVVPEASASFSSSFDADTLI